MISNSSLSQSLIDSAARITDEDIENIKSIESPELNSLINAEIILTRRQRNTRGEVKNRARKK